ncbi:MAG: DUF2007 domain-containing protein [Bacteroidota bacterium]
MLESNYTKLFSGSFIIVKLAMERLEAVGIKPIIKDESKSARLAGFGSSIQNFQELYVHNDELEKALPLIKIIKQEISTD